MSNVSSPEPTIADTRTSAENKKPDLPLKHRLRSSSRQQNNRIEDEVDKMRDSEKEQNALEDQNAAAILSIINANITNNTISDKRILDDPKELTIKNENKVRIISNTPICNNVILKSLASTDIQKTSNVAFVDNNIESKVKKSTVKRPRPTKLKRDQAMNNQSIKEEMTMPTLVVCSKDEISNILTINHSSTIRSTSTSRFVPIAPKDTNKIEEPVRPMFLRTVTVAQKTPVDETLLVKEPNNFTSQMLEPQKKNTKASKKLKTVHDKPDTTVTVNNEQVMNLEALQTGKIVGSESITLYGTETSVKTLLDSTNIPMINLDENISLSESGLSPYLKFNCNKSNQNHNLSDIDVASIMEATKSATTNNNFNEQQSTISKNAGESDIITKHTPNSLLKSRSKNRKLSLSTPRKRSSHIRALDFSTPQTLINSTRKTNGNGATQFSSTSVKHLKSVCRTSLFKSPPFSNSPAITVQKSPVKVCQSYKIPIATRSPAPKLMGDWDKYNGVGVIIGDVSSHGSASSSSEDRVQHRTSKTPAESWDADLRKGILLNKIDETETKRPVKKKGSTKDDNNKIHKKKYNPRPTKSKGKRKTHERNRESNETEEDSQGTVVKTEKNQRIAAVMEPRNNVKEHVSKIAINATASSTIEPNKTSESIDIHKTPVTTNNSASNDIRTEKKPVKKYAQLKTIRTNLRSDGESKKSREEAPQISSQAFELSRILTVDNTQHGSITRMPDMINLETPKKLNDIPPTPRMLSPSSNITTPFIKVSEDSSRIRDFISTPEFPKTPCIAITPKHTEDTTRDVAKRSDYGSLYYKPTSEQALRDPDKISKSENILNTQKSPIISSSSHMKLNTMHDNSLITSSPCQMCTSSKLEITQFEVIKENLPKEEAIKELKIASNSKDSANAMEFKTSAIPVDLIQTNELKEVDKRNETAVDDNYQADSSSASDVSTSSGSSSSSSTSTTDTNTSTTCSSIEKCNSTAKSVTVTECTNATTQDNISANKPLELNNPSVEVKKPVITAEKHAIVQETLTLDKAKQETRNQTEDKANKLQQCVNHVDKSKCILKCKVDQVKRDLFSDEENDQRAIHIATARDSKMSGMANASETPTKNPVLLEVPSSVSNTKENINIENPKEKLSTVLQCLQLVPAQKNEQIYDDQNQTEKCQEPNKCKDISEIEKSNQTFDAHNYKAEYHFVYDDSAPIRKRRRRYSAHELQIKINYADLSDPESVEDIKIFKATEFEEIFNLPPKSKKRTFTKRACGKNEKSSRICNPKANSDTLILKEGTTKPLATSSPVGSLEAKTKIIKTAATNRANNDVQPDSKKKLKLEKPQEKGTVSQISRLLEIE